MGSYAIRRVPAGTPYYSKTKESVQVGAWIATPGWLRDQTEKLRAEWITIGKEIHADYNNRCLGLEAPEAGSEACVKMQRFRDDVWAPMSQRFYSFAAKHGDASYAKLLFRNFWGNVWDQIKEWRVQLISLREQAEAAGFFFQSPKPLPPERGPWDTIFTMLKWIVGAVVGALGVWALMQLVKGFRSN